MLNSLPLEIAKVTKKTLQMLLAMKNMIFFGSDDIYSDFEGFDEEEILSTDPYFTPTKNRSHDKNTDGITNVQQKTAVEKSAPEEFSMNN